VKLDKSADLSSVRQTLLNLFFPNGKSKAMKLDVNDLICNIANFNGDNIASTVKDPFTVESYIAGKSNPVRLYLHTCPADDDDDDRGDDYLPPFSTTRASKTQQLGQIRSVASSSIGGDSSFGHYNSNLQLLAPTTRVSSGVQSRSRSHTAGASFGELFNTDPLVQPGSGTIRPGALGSSLAGKVTDFY